MRIDKAKVRMPKPSSKKDNLNVNQRVSVYSESYKGEYYNIDTDKLVPFKNQARTNFDNKSLEEMASTIKSHGIRQPLTVITSEENQGKYEVVSGERRWKAALLIGLKKVPCIILQDVKSAEEIALIENVQRKNLHPLELMKGLQGLLDSKTCNTHQEIANKIGVARSFVVEILGLSRLPSSTQKLLLDNSIKSRDVLRKLLKTPESEHSLIINNSKPLVKLDQSSYKVKRKKLISIHVEENELVFNEAKVMDLSSEQKLEFKEYLVQLAAKI